MNVIIANKQKDLLANLDIELIKSMSGEFEAEEIARTFMNFFYDKMILDITAIKDYQDITNIQKISLVIDVEKLIVVIPPGDEATSSGYLTKLISLGIYNFTSTVDGIVRLLEHPNTYEKVAHIPQLDTLSSTIGEKIQSGSKIIGIRNITDHAGSTTLVYMLKKELERMFGPSIYAVEINRTDFSYFNDKNMVSTRFASLKQELVKLEHAAVILIDLNDCEDDSVCSDVLYLLEPSSIKLNKLMKRNRNIFERLQGKKIILNKSLLTSRDLVDFEYEAKTKIFYNLPPLDERKQNEVLKDFLSHLGVLEKRKENNHSEGKIFGLFKR